MPLQNWMWSPPEDVRHPYQSYMNYTVPKFYLQVYLLGQILLGYTIPPYETVGIYPRTEAGFSCSIKFYLPRKNIFNLHTVLPEMHYLLLHLTGFKTTGMSHLISTCQYHHLQLQLFLTLPFPSNILSQSGIRNMSVTQNGK